MLTSDQSLVTYTSGLASPDRLTRVTHKHYVAYANQMLAVYRNGIDTTRRELHRAIRNIFANEPDCPRQRIAAFCKLMDDASEFDTDRKGADAKLRLQVFSLSAPMQPLVSEADQIFERTEKEAKSTIALQLGKPWQEIERSLYVDVIDHQPLLEFEGFDSPAAVLSAYNLGQLQACLYKCQKMSVEASSDFAAIIRQAKLSRLLVQIRRISETAYCIDLTGPASLLQETRRYGVNFARFIGTLVSCKGWTMRAHVTTPWGSRAMLKITSEDGFRSHVAAPPAFDSEVEASFAVDWGESRDGWTLHRDAGLLQHGQATFVPDFLLRHEDGREAFLEIVGFWTPEYLKSKRQTLSLFRDTKILLAVQSKLAKPDADLDGVVLYKTRVKPEKVLELLAKLA